MQPTKPRVVDTTHELILRSRGRLSKHIMHSRVSRTLWRTPGSNALCEPYPSFRGEADIAQKRRAREESAANADAAGTREGGGRGPHSDES